MLFTLGLYLAFGAVAGILAGLLGLGGGIVIVPMLNYAFAMQNMPSEHIQLMAVATSMACILFTSISSVRAHHARGSVNWSVWRTMTPGILAGTFGGTWIAVLMPQAFLRGFFICFLVFVAVQMLRPLKVSAGRAMPGTATFIGGGTVIGFISSLVGIGGGTMSVPFLSWATLDFRTCIGTSAAIGFPIALAGSLGYLVNGWNVAGLPPHTLGFIYLPALLGIAVASMVFAIFGVRLAHKLPIPQLRRVFAVFILVVAADMLRKMI